MKVFLALVVLCFCSLNFVAQTHENSFPVIWYNVENLFDCTNDSATADDIFTPEGDKHWTTYRYWVKIKNLSKAILAVSGWSKPGLIGLCEIENEQVLEDLVYNSPLSGLKLKYIHQDSPDKRGIDVALLYNPTLFKPFSTQFLTLTDPHDLSWTSRDLLYCKGLVHELDTLHCFVNHWPSKYGGAVQSEPKRILASKLLIRYCDSILVQNPKAMILAMGDFNESSSEPALKYVEDNGMEILKLNDAISGTHKYRGNWSQIDYFIISEQLKSSDMKSFSVTKHTLGDVPFLLEPDDAYSGLKPFRTYVGYKYHGGFSDHLPIVLYLGKK